MKPRRPSYAAPAQLLLLLPWLRTETPGDPRPGITALNSCAGDWQALLQAADAHRVSSLLANYPARWVGVLREAMIIGNLGRGR